MSLTHKLKRRYKLFLLMALFLALVIWNPAGLFAPIRNFVFTVTSPIQKITRNFSIGGQEVFHFMVSIGQLREENERLYKENQQLKSQIALQESYQSENEDLRKQLDLLPKEKFDLENSFVISQDSAQGGWLVIGKGSSSGIKENMPVVAYNGILLGHIEEVFLNTSRIILLNNPDSSANAQAGDSATKGIVQGNFGLGIIIEMINQSDPLEVGDKVVTSGIGETYPAGLLIGNISQIQESSDKLFKRATVASPIKFSDLKIVSVIKNAKP